MNRYDWNNPPPPGTEFDSPDEDSNISGQKNDPATSSDQGSNNQIDPPIKNPVSQGPENEISSEKIPLRSRSKSSERPKRRKRSRSHSRRSRSHSRDRRRRSPSRSRRRRRKYSSSRSRSRSRSLNYRHRQRRHGRRYSRSGSRSRTTKTRSQRSTSDSRSRSYRSERDRKSPKVQHTEGRRDKDYIDKELDGDIIGEEDMKIEEPGDEVAGDAEVELDQGPVPFKNDGSFLEMFKRMQEQQKASEEPPQEAIPKKPLLPPFGKRRGGKVLKTGMVAKVRNIEEESTNAQDAWSVYMKEVRKYKEVHCDDDSKTRPLVK